MKQRGDKYWEWANINFHIRSHEEILHKGINIDIQTRLSPTGDTQLFIGIYAKGGIMMLEEVYGSMPGETMTRALLWGTMRARAIAEEGTQSRPERRVV